MEQPLKGIRILDLGIAIAVPLAMRNLALLGAEVIRIESTKRAGLAADPFPWIL